MQAMDRPQTIDILCKVVDNYGDIGVVYRLAKALSELDPTLSLRLHVDDLGAFAALCPDVDPAAEIQRVRGWTIVRWNSSWEGLRAPPPRLVLECFACGRPERFEEILFDPADRSTRYIVNIEHLTAEPWASDFHRLPSATRSGLVKKVFFMPGFESDTGGLIIDGAFREALARWNGYRRGTEGRQKRRDDERSSSPEAPLRVSAGDSLARARRELAAKAGLALPPGAEKAFWVPIFSYERAYRRIVGDLAAFGEMAGSAAPLCATKIVGRPILALAAAGRSQSSFMAAWEAAGRPFSAIALPFLPQETWDELLLAADFSIVRGEESLARAALAGRPFLWHAYLQDGGHHQVKVRALLDRMRPYFAAEDFPLLEGLWLAFNDRLEERPEAGGNEPLLPFLRRAQVLETSFSAFARDLVGFGDLAAHLVTFLHELV